MKARHVPLATLLAECDWIVPQLPTAAATRDLLGRAELAQVKPGACIVNVANAPIINRDALIEALARPAGWAASRSTFITRSRLPTTIRCSASTTSF